MHQKPFFLHRFRHSANVNPHRLFWILRLALAFLLLLLALFPSLQVGSSPASVKAIAVLALAILGVICFLDVKRESVSEVETGPSSISAAKPSHLYPAQNKPIPTGSENFQEFRIHSIVAEVNKLVEQHQLTRKTVELFVLPQTDGSRFIARAVARLKAAGFAIRPHAESATFEEISLTGQSLIGVKDGCVHVFLGDR